MRHEIEDTGPFGEALRSYQDLREQALEAFELQQGRTGADLMVEAIEAFELAITFAGRII